MPKGGKTVEDKNKPGKYQHLNTKFLERVDRAKTQKEVVEAFMDLDKSKLPVKYREIPTYIKRVKENMREELGGNISQAQQYTLDSIGEILMVIKIFTGYIAEHPEELLDSKKSFMLRTLYTVLLSFHSALDRKTVLYYKLDDVFKMIPESEAEKAMHAMGIMPRGDRGNGG